MNNSNFYICSVGDRMKSDLNNYPDIFMFHNCCKSLERVSIRYMNWNFSFGHDFNNDEDRKLILIQNILIKFVRNAPPTLHWFRSDLTLDNMTMLRMERPGIELLNWIKLNWTEYCTINYLRTYLLGHSHPLPGTLMTKENTTMDMLRLPLLKSLHSYPYPQIKLVYVYPSNIVVLNYSI